MLLGPWSFMLLVLWSPMFSCTMSSSEEVWLRLQCEVLSLQLQSKEIEIRSLKEDISRFEESITSFNRIVRAAERNIAHLSSKIEQQKTIIRREVRPKSWA